MEEEGEAFRRLAGGGVSAVAWSPGISFLCPFDLWFDDDLA